jgi:hypothetical protein
MGKSRTLVQHDCKHEVQEQPARSAYGGRIECAAYDLQGGEVRRRDYCNQQRDARARRRAVCERREDDAPRNDPRSLQQKAGKDQNARLIRGGAKAAKVATQKKKGLGNGPIAKPKCDEHSARRGG